MNYDCPVADVQAMPAEERRSHMKIIAEIKRDSGDATSAKNEQLKPALDLVPNTDAIGIYWDDVEQSTFFKEMVGTSAIYFNR